ncbi:DUF418 domain-containing protein [Egibacter rhizosphaerae]|uniref:DUF418 domain-containing protein n=1 Tax=Egibacter rhizosphaerae TaxID=1670831 RepID=A0A411YI70_9ACTN|nr:DUF418 domain-containing protein [Egibacter rhizosphaerae]QBI20920.1 DUF418 domain-containing protein [Egibacter rhizosphaerae]
MSSLDALRGLAVAGMLLVNVVYMTAPVNRLLLAGEPLPGGEADRALVAVVRVVAEHKFLPLFAVLFGVGLSLVATRLRARGIDPGEVLARRLLVLFGIGLAHAVLLWSGDILAAYGVLGIVVVGFVGRSPRLVAGVGVVALVVAPAVRWAFTDGGTGAGRTEAARQLAAEADASFTSGSFGAMTAQRIDEFAITAFGHAADGPHLLGLMLLGLALARWGVPARPWPSVPPWAGAVGIAAALVVGLAASMYAVGAGSDTFAGMIARDAGGVLLGGTYAVGLLCWLRRRPDGRLARVLCPLGRAALTAYVLQSVLVANVVYWSGGFGQVPVWQVYPLVFAVLAVQVAGSRWWLRRHAHGPLEGVWRRLTYARATAAR